MDRHALGRPAALHPQQGFRSYTLRDGFASNEIAAVTQDPQGNTWVATSYGLALITASTERVITYFQTDRLQTQQFYPHCSLNTMSMIYFGGNTGLAQFAPGRVIPKITKSPVPLVLTEIRINSVVQHPAEGETLTRTLNDTERIVLNHKQRNIDIGYEAVTFLSPENVATPTASTAATSTRSGTTSRTDAAPTTHTCPPDTTPSN